MNIREHEHEYRDLILRFLNRSIPVEEFIDDYFRLWKLHRDRQWADIHRGEAPCSDPLQALLDRVFGACDAYDPTPVHTWEINEDELRSEIQELVANRWRL